MAGQVDEVDDEASAVLVIDGHAPEEAVLPPGRFILPRAFNAQLDA